MIEELLPAAVSAAEAFEDPPGAVLFPAEEAVIAAAVDKRRREFTTARLCARTALARLGYSPAPILPGPRGAPEWPDGAVGSMTHCAGYRAAAVAHCRDVRAIGVDAEPHERLPDGVLDAVALADEQSLLRRLSVDEPGVWWDRLLFCAKEAVYKAWFPLTGRWLGFADADITIDATERAFTARIQVPAPVINGSALASFTGRWLANEDLILAAIAVPA
jgi:4'-phosphopantetheinyl transferase EntD